MSSIELDTIADAVRQRKPILVLGVEYVPAAEDQPPSVRAEVLRAVSDIPMAERYDVRIVRDVVLPVVADWLAARGQGKNPGRPLVNPASWQAGYDYAVRSLRGGSA